MNTQLIEIIAKLCKLFDNDYHKVMVWLEEPSHSFGYIAPIKLIKMDRGHKVLQFIDDAADGNLP